MVNEYKKIVLVGLESISDYNFRIIKSLLGKELKLTKKMQENYDRLMIADLMEDKFPKDAGVKELIEIYTDMPTLEGLVDRLKEKKANVKRRQKERGNIAMRRHRQDISSTSQPTSTTNDDLKQESTRDTPSSQRTRMENESIETLEESGYPQGPKEVMVLQVTEPFGIGGEKKMFHATVATETEFFRVKVFVIVLKEKFIPNKLIAISEYYARNGFLEIYSASCVSDVNGNCVMYVPSALREKATVTPKIIHLCSHGREIFVNGDFNVFKKHVRNECTYYGIGDDTGIMEVVVYGRLTNIDCEPGDRLRLFCFELASSADRWQLRSVRHSYMQVIKGGNERQPLNPEPSIRMTIESSC